MSQHCGGSQSRGQENDTDTVAETQQTKHKEFPPRTIVFRQCTPPGFIPRREWTSSRRLLHPRDGEILQCLLPLDCHRRADLREVF